MLLSLAVICIGVTMGYAVHLINRSALDEFSQAVQSLMGNADLEIRGPRSGFNEKLYPRLAHLPEVTAASPIVEVDAKIPGQRETLHILGIDVFRAGPIHPNLIGQTAQLSSDRGRDAPPAQLDTDAIFLSPAALRWLNVKVGQTIEVQAGLQTIRLRVAGTLPNAGAGIKLATMDIGAAQWRFNRIGMLSRIDLKLRQGANIDDFRAQLSAVLPAGVLTETPQDTQSRASNLSRAYRVNLNALALVALFTGGFLVFSNQALSVVRRRAELALLRVLGMTRLGLVKLLLAESLLIGIIGSLMGLAIGYIVAHLALANFGGDLGGGYFSGVTPRVHFSAPFALIFLALGIATAAIGSIVPAMEAAIAKPAQALKAGNEESALTVLRRPWPGLFMISIGLVLSKAGPIAGLPLPGYMAIVLLLIGGISLQPIIAHLFFSHLPMPRQPVIQLALAQLAGSSGRASLAISGIVASFSLMVAMAIMVASFRDSVDQWLSHMLPADLYVRAAGNGDTGFLASQDVERILTTPGVARAEFLRSNQLALDTQHPPITLLSRKIDASNPAARLPLVGSTVSIPKNVIPIWVSEAMVDLYGFNVGKTIQLPLGGNNVACLVGGVWRDYARQHGSIVIRDEDYRRVTGDTTVSDAALWLSPGFSSGQIIATLRATLSGVEGLEFAEPGEIRAVSLRIFDRSFGITYVLEAVAILIGLTGVAASFGAQALARAREFGMLRHIGMTRRQIGMMLAIEGGTLALLGLIVGMGLGWIVSLILVYVVNPQSFHWTMDLHIPWAMIAISAAALFVAAGVTAVLSGRQAMSRSAVMAVREDW